MRLYDDKSYMNLTSLAAAAANICGGPGIIVGNAVLPTFSI
jgi:hypothetical protein